MILLKPTNLTLVNLMGVRVANIISSICNSTNINGRSIGKIQIFNDYSLVDLPRDLHRETQNKLKKIKVRN